MAAKVKKATRIDLGTAEEKLKARPKVPINKPGMGQGAKATSSVFEALDKSPPIGQGASPTPSRGIRGPGTGTNLIKMVDEVVQEVHKVAGPPGLRYLANADVRLGGDSVVRGILGATGVGGAIFALASFLKGSPAGEGSDFTPEEQQAQQMVNEGSPAGEGAVPEQAGRVRPADFITPEQIAQRRAGITNANTSPAMPQEPAQAPPVAAAPQVGAPAPVTPPAQSVAPPAQAEGTPVSEVQTGAGAYPVYAKGSLDAMEFREAFKKARAEMGDNATFTWRGRLYTTKLKSK